MLRSIGKGGLLLGLVALILGVLSLPKSADAVRKTDALLSRERLMTACAFAEETGHAYELQRRDAEGFMDTHPLKGIEYPWALNFRPYKIGFLLLLLAVGMAALPTPAAKMAKEIEAVREGVLVESEALEAVLEEKLEKASLDEAQKDEVRALLAELTKALEKVRSEEEALKEVSVAKNKLKDMEQLLAEAQLEQIQKKLQALERQTEEMKEAEAKGEDLTDEQREAMEEALEALQEAYEALSEEEMAALAQMSEVTQEEMEAAMEALANALESGEFGEALDQMATMSEALASADQSMAQAAASLSEMMAAINAAGNNMSDSPSLSQMAFATTSGGGQNPSGAVPSEAAQGNGAGASPFGTSNEDGGYQEESPDGSLDKHDGDPVTAEGTYEAVNESELIGGSSDPDMVSGQQQDGGEISYTQVKTIPTDSGELVGYSEVLADYHQEAMEQVDDLEVPAVMKTIVRDYFSGLNEE